LLNFEQVDNTTALVTGSGIEILRFKAIVHTQNPGWRSVTPTNNSLQIPLEILVSVLSELDFQTSITTSLQASINDLTAKNKRHEISLHQFHEFLDSGVPHAENTYWAEILKPHQLIAAEAMCIEGLRGVCLFDEQGVGKTLTTIASFDLLKEKSAIDALLIVAPKTLTATWVAEFEQFLPSTYSVIEISGTKSERFRKIQSNADVYISTFDGATNDAALLSTLIRSKKFLLTVDESYFAKNPEAQRSASIMRLRALSEKAFVLCGTPAPNKPTDIIQQVNISDNGYAFQNYVPDDDKFITASQIGNILKSRAAVIRRTKDQVLPDLPKKNLEIISVRLSGTQLELYDHARRELVLYLQRIDNKAFKRNLATYFQKRATLLQICISPSLIGHADSSSIKYETLSKLLHKLVVEQGKKVVIWSAYTRSTDHMARLFEQYGVSRVDGTVVNSVDRSLAIKKFQEDPNTRIFLGNAAAAGAGITLTAAECAIYVSFSNQAAHYMQSLDRIHRIGQAAEQVTYYFLIAKDTIEEFEIQSIWRKQSAQSDLLGDSQVSEFSRELALRELGVTHD
jgi:SNF2 family DNA or RNA helicase